VTIRPGQAWGELVDPPPGLVTVADDADLADHLAREGAGPVSVAGGDLLRTIGGPSRDGRVRRYRLDLLWVTVDGDPPVPAVAHVVARSPGPWRWWPGPLWAACNVSHVGRWDVAPRAHPNDGRLDVVEVDASMSWRARLEAARRLPAGSHVPHPAIHVGRATQATFAPGRPVAVLVDGRERRRAERVEVVIAPDAGWVHA
jgi:hypothetical protein